MVVPNSKLNMKSRIKHLLFTTIVFTSKAFKQLTTYVSTIKPLKNILIQMPKIYLYLNYPCPK
jgi:hypothetical protein